MRFATGAAMAMALSACYLHLVAAQSSTKKKAKRRSVAAAPRVSPAPGAAAAKKVDTYLENSAETSVAQPGALAPVFEQLHRLNAGPKRQAVHMIHFGDSHTAADQWTGGLRDLLKGRFGDGGSGFSLAGRPFRGYRRFDIRGGATPIWKAEGLRTGSGDGYFGLGGVSISSARAGESVYIDTECSDLEIHFLQQPGGGDVTLYDDQDLLDRFSTAGELAAGFVRYEVPSGPHRFVMKTVSAAQVRLFGWVADKRTGVTYEALGINGAEASVIMRWDENMLANYLQRRNPGLIVLAYGTNEASDPSWTPETYREMYSALLHRLRKAAGTASILVIGPGDRWARYRGRLRPVPGIDWIIAAQQSACQENRCAFWDTRQRMGGKGSMRDWVYAGLAQPDYVHFTAAGYRRLAEVLYQDIMRQYQGYRTTRQEITDQGHEPANQNY